MAVGFLGRARRNRGHVWILGRSVFDRISFRKSGRAPIRSIAVLPLENLSGDPEQEYFSDGMTDALITVLTKIEALKVISRTSTMLYKGTNKPLPEIARELNVDAVVEGSVLRAGDRVRITAQLIHAETDQHLWAESYERELRDILALQRRSSQGHCRRNPDRHDTRGGGPHVPFWSGQPRGPRGYLRGLYHLNKRTPADLRQAIDYFQQAIDTDPDFALPYAYLAHSFALAGGEIGPIVSAAGAKHSKAKQWQTRR